MESSGAGDIRGGAKAREISALGISETSLARVTPRPFRRKFKFHRIEAAPACKRTGIRKRSFVCAPNEQTDGARDNVVRVDCMYVRTYVRTYERYVPRRGGEPNPDAPLRRSPLGAKRGGLRAATRRGY